MTGTASASLPTRLSTAAGRLGYRVANRWLRAFRYVAGSNARGVRCVLRRGDRVLLVRHTYGERGWALPGGRIRRGESPEQAARRELSQELGMEVDGWYELGALGTRRGRGTYSTVYLRADVDQDHVEPSPRELSAVAWFAADELPERDSEAIARARYAGFL